ncbi:hypothetical protein D3C87_712680 [compost metagenome]
MKRYSCILVEDDVLAIDMMEDYINRRDDLILRGISTQLSELKKLLVNIEPAIIFLDLIIPPGESQGFHLGELPSSAHIAIISAIPLSLYKGSLPKGPTIELSKPISFEKFNSCVEQIILKIKNQ